MYIFECIQYVKLVAFNTKQIFGQILTQNETDGNNIKSNRIRKNHENRKFWIMTLVVHQIMEIEPMKKI